MPNDMNRTDGRRSYVLFKKESGLDNLHVDRESLPIHIWQPSLFRPRPQGAPSSLSYWWLYHFTRVLRNRPSYAIFICYKDDAVVHYSLASFKCFKFPFMEKRDIHIGPIWTSPEFRSRGLATSAVSRIIMHFAMDNRRYWSMVDEENEPSVRVFENLGFVSCGIVSSDKRLLVSIYGSEISVGD
jgi:RimJ/RimL family protein N-acetyltransferase